MRLPARLWCRRLHLLLGLGLGSVLVAVALSGAALVFREEIRRFDPASTSVQAWDGRGDRGFPAARDQARSHADHHGLRLHELDLPGPLQRYYEAGFLKADGSAHPERLRLHPATLATLPRPKSPLLDWLEVFHTDLHLGSTGALLVRWSSLLFAVLLLSGLYLWWPGLKPHLWLTLRRGRLRLWDSHRVLGFFAALPLLAMVLTGVVFAFAPARTAIHRLTGAPPPTTTPDQAALWRSEVPTAGTLPPLTDEQAVALARPHAPAEAFLARLRFPTAPDQPLEIIFQQGLSPRPHGERHHVFLDRYDGRLLGRLGPDDNFASHFVARTNKEIHSGAIGGLATRILWLIACLLVPFFAVTGLLLSRRRALAARRQTRALPASPRPDPEILHPPLSSPPF
jgi:uncharacterized iron-regulated membrane protein